MEPDKWDRAYIHRQLCGFSHLLNEQVARHQQQAEQHRHELQSWHERIAVLETQLAERDVLMGELRARLEALEQRHERLRSYLKDRIKGNGDLGLPVVSEPPRAADPPR